MEKNIVNTSSYISPDFHPLRLLAGESSAHHRKPRKKRTNNHHNNNFQPVPNPKPARKPDPAAPKITRPCTECGRKFWSWKALFGHMRCHPEREWRGIVPPPNVRRHPPEITDEDHEVAACLLILAGGPPLRASDTCTVNQGASEECSDEMANTCGRFECTSCKKVFGSHQALGGHRASHKNVKGCYAITKIIDGEEFDQGCCSLDFHHSLMMNDHSNGHKCNICFRVFSSGQALGGHMRCHWEKAGEPSRVFDFDLNLAAPLQDEDDRDHTYFACSSGVALDLRLGL